MPGLGYGITKTRLWDHGNGVVSREGLARVSRSLESPAGPTGNKRSMWCLDDGPAHRNPDQVSDGVGERGVRV